MLKYKTYYPKRVSDVETAWQAISDQLAAQCGDILTNLWSTIARFPRLQNALDNPLDDWLTFSWSLPCSSKLCCWNSSFDLLCTTPYVNCYIVSVQSLCIGRTTARCRIRKKWYFFIQCVTNFLFHSREWQRQRPDSATNCLDLLQNQFWANFWSWLF